MKENVKLAALYGRVSTQEQSPDSQLRELRRYCEARGLIIFREYVDVGISGKKEKRPELDKLVNDAKKRRFDLVLVFRFDRFARSARHLVNALEEFKALGIGFISYSENIDLTSPVGQAMFTIISAMAQLERDIIRERVLSGLKAAKERGIILGRPKTIDSAKVKDLRAQGLSFNQIAQKLNIGKGSAHRLSKSLFLKSEVPKF